MDLFKALSRGSWVLAAEIRKLARKVGTAYAACAGWREIGCGTNYVRLQQLTPGLIYVLLCVAVGAVQVIDAYALSTAAGRASAVTTAFSFFEYVWAGTSLYVWWLGSFEVPNWLPLSFVGYVVLMALAGAIAASRRRDEMALSPAVVVIGGVFGAYFCVAATCVALVGE